MKGILYGVGVGPGDPELLTAKAIRLLRECDAVAAPKSADGRQTALDIASPYIGQDKTILLFDMPMTHDRQARNASHNAAADALCALLDAGKTVVFLTLGDPTVYSTYVVCTQACCRPRLCSRSWCPACRPSAPRLLPWAAPCARTAKCCTSFRPRTAGRRKGSALSGSKVLMKTGKQCIGASANCSGSAANSAARHSIERGRHGRSSG